MRRVLVTGATGNVGLELLKALSAARDVAVLAGVRDPARSSAAALTAAPKAELVRIDFEDESTYVPALTRCDSLFLLRPPHLNCDFAKLIPQAECSGVRHIVFLSVQGAEKNRFIPHHRTERLLIQSGVPYTLLRPAYFLQNFTTIFRADITERNRVSVPAGNARFAIIDVCDVARAAAEVLTQQGSQHLGQAYTLTSEETLTFSQMTSMLSAALGRPIQYLSPNAVSFYREQRRAGLSRGMIAVMFLLHYLARFAPEPQTTDSVLQLTGHRPAGFPEFVARNLELFNCGDAAANTARNDP